MKQKTAEPNYLEGLNDVQRQAVTHGADPLLILAGAGSGKTRVVTSRIAWLVAEKGFQAPSILAVTFTNKAAAEMRERVNMFVSGAGDAMIRTFHSFGAWLLRRNGKAIGVSSGFTIYDDDDQVSLLSQLLNDVPRRELRLWAHRISRAKDEGLGPDDNLDGFSHDPAFPGIFKRYETRLREIGNVDFGDLIRLPVKLLREHPRIKSRLQQRFQAILVDEYQDTNVAQYQLLHELVGPNTWVGVVGDDDQSIYRFRGADVGNILTFQDIFPDTRVIKLEQNYRSTGTILDIASSVVAHNSGRLGKTLWTAGDRGDKAKLVYLDDHEAEAEWCANLVDSDGRFGETAILYRTNAQSRSFETCFRRRNIPYRLVGTLSFYQREEVKDVLAYLAWLSNPRDEVAFRRIANKPARGLGKTSLNKFVTHAIEEFGGDFGKAVSKAVLSKAVLDNAPSVFKGRAAKALVFLAELTERYSSVENFEHLGFLIQDLAKSSGLLSHYRDVDRIENTQRTRNLDELVTAAADYPANPEGLTAFLELVELDQAMLEEEVDDDNRVTLITMHNTKGLEFDRVIITGMEEGLFPRGDESPDDEELEEERRLFYVAITRARFELAFTCCRRRMLWGRFRETVPSRFLRELPDEFVQVEGDGDVPESFDDPWKPGVRICHDDYGVGVIQKRIANNGHTVITVMFESGRNATLLPEFSSHQMEVLGAVEDWG